MGFGAVGLLFFGWLACAYERPLTFAGLYAGLSAVLALARQAPLALVAPSAALGFVFAAVYFWLLARFSDSLALWLAIFIGVPLLVLAFQFHFVVAPMARD